MLRRSGRGAVAHVRFRRGGVRLGQAVALRSGISGHVKVRLGWVGSVSAVGARSGLDGFGELGCGTGMARFGLAVEV